MAVTRLILSDYRNYPALELAPGPGFVLLSGRNGAGKTNILEALSLLAPGRGLRAAPLPDIARIGGAGGFAVAARLGEVELGTGTLAGAADRRKVRINGAPAPVNALADYLSILWLTPAMDRLFAGSSGDRRRFLDRLVLAGDPSHARHAARYEAAMRSRNRLLGETARDDGWLDALEAQMVDHGGHVAKARERTVTALDERLAGAPADDFLKASVALTPFSEDDFATALRDGRSRDAKAGRTLVGPHRQDLDVARRDTGMPASHCSTGEQKALLLGVVLAHAEVVADRQTRPPLLLLDEVAAHLDPRRREALFDRLNGRGQIWMTATEASLFDGIGEATHYVVAEGRVDRAP